MHAADDVALRTASEKGHLAVVKLLLDAGADVHAADDVALRKASENGHLAVVELLLDAGADVHAFDDDALQLASRSSHLDVLNCLLRAGANVNAGGGAALSCAIENFCLDTVERLLAAGAGVHAISARALDTAISFGCSDVVERLLLAGADPSTFEWKELVTDWPALVQCVRRAHFHSLPTNVQPLWIRFNLSVRLRLAQYLQRARNRLDRPPSSALGTLKPTRDELIAHLRTAGRRFAREYWTEGLPLFFPNADLGPVPDEFVWGLVQNC